MAPSGWGAVRAIARGAGFSTGFHIGQPRDLPSVRSAGGGRRELVSDEFLAFAGALVEPCAERGQLAAVVRECVGPALAAELPEIIHGAREERAPLLAGQGVEGPALR